MKATIDSSRRVANIFWTAPINSADLDYYSISVDDGPPMLTKNTSILYDLSLSRNYFTLRAVDRCGQQGSTANITVEVAPPENEAITCNGTKKGIILVSNIILFMLIISADSRLSLIIMMSCIIIYIL